MDSSLADKSQGEIIEELQRQLVVEKNRNKTLTEEIKHLREQHARIQIVTENEEEYITNKFMKYLNQLKKEKEELALKVEQEEEYLTNTLQKKMLAIMKEKVDLENQLEQEEEFIVNKLQKQIQEVMKDKKVLEKRLENEINDHKYLLKLEDEVIELRDKIKELEKEQGEGIAKKEDIDALKAENFVLGQKIIREQEKLSKVNSENTRLMSNLEIDDERNFNKSKRNRSISFPNERLASSNSSISSASSSSSSISSLANNINTSPTITTSSSCSSTCSSSNNSKIVVNSVPITRSRSSSSNSNPCLVSKLLKEGWMKRKFPEGKLEKRFYEISTDGELKEYIDDAKQLLVQSIDLDTVSKVDIVADPQHNGYSDLEIHISHSSKPEIVILSNYTEEINDWKLLISDLIPSPKHH
ncbi:hypothetical protein DICPUDRAFT_94376 [Dictyostelium purpureum]|uniref:PH domain-containing protein n=1 Tax=Dictyostelium purpureum TaxID=5786 RepID=F0ZIS8_DICPU|nr:uncharacterized protein DICPUDRAFT_94376 [Dictyostelium purpureum]EGC36141.1 hypothetical protein DICPUDRAFT_94376 [Dictyostelium purpureum]|eukprot:XP_003287334.1 hypothetical protein DICPUDRAFT_94376 [Dictyostelium purpureum]